jgi:hypothetical protein
MFDQTTADGPGSELRDQAMLYAAGELTKAGADAFEDRLLDDELAQQALVQAVQLDSLIARAPCCPDRTYRARVREALLPKPFWKRRRPLVAATGYAAAALVCVWSLFFPSASQHAPTKHALETARLAAPVPTDKQESNALQSAGPVDESEDMLEMAETWAELSNCDHLQKTLEDEQRRRARLHPDELRAKHLPARAEAAQ